MEGREGISSGVTVIGAEAPSAYHMAPRSEPPTQSHVPAAAGGGGGGSGAAAVVGVGVSPMSVGMDGTSLKKKRGRPRKYGPEGAAVTMALSPLPISSSAPHSNNDFSSGKRGKPKGMEYKQHKKVGLENLDGSIGTNFMPHIITVEAGEDITMKVVSFSQQGPRVICILSATGVISNVTLRHPDSFGGTLTYEGRFQILNLSGSFVPAETQGTRSRAGGMSITLASPDGRVVGGGVAGCLVAGGPVQLVVASFLQNDQRDYKPSKVKVVDNAPTNATPVSVAPPTVPFTNAEKEGGTGGHVMQNSGAMNSKLTSPPPFRRENWVNMHSVPDSRNSGTDINVSLPDN